ncbi:hypothetical protein [Lachnoclostridium phytofermentans]|uniref:hypothetical protein n=1 Tax=Lachnoclostridium phytofermentans TaxID=66219 RepID=UPI00059FC714|nr:hypothetical protein [Lachnoclostridium phytofermentans]
MNELISELNSRGVNFIRGVDISMLSKKENRGYYVAILLGIVLRPDYIIRISKENIADHSEFGVKEHLALRNTEVHFA